MRQTRLLPSFLLLASLTLTKQAAAQAPAPSYTYTTITTLESGSKSASKLFITPAFNGKTEVQLEDFSAFASEKNKEKFQNNAQTVNTQLAELSAAGWELVQVYPMPFFATPSQNVFITRYLLRKARP